MRRLSKKWANYRRRYHFFRLTEAPPTGPLYINVEPTNACNLKCRTCSIDGTRQRGFMDFDLFRKIIDDAASINVYEVALFMGGEPLLHKELPRLVKYTASKGLEPRIYTNACLLDREKSEALLDAGLSFMGISFDGDNKEEYEAMRSGAKYEEVLENVLTFLKLKQEKGLRQPYVSLQMIKLLDNPRQEIDPAFRALFEGLPIDEMVARNPHDWRGEKENIALPRQGKKYYPCQVFWSAMSIAWDGRVVGCSADLNGRFIFGDLKRQSIMEVWNGEEMVRYRHLLKRGRFSELPLCARCHALWHHGRLRRTLLFQLPPFEQLRNVILRISPGKWRQEQASRSAGAIRSKKK